MKWLKIALKLISLPFWGITAILLYNFLEILLVPRYAFGGLSNVAFFVIGIMLGCVIAASLWMVGTKKEKRKKTMLVMMLTASCLYGMGLFAILFGSVDTTRRNSGIHIYSLVPFRTILEYYQAYLHNKINPSVIYYNIFGNLFLFCPAGFALPYFVKKCRKIGWFSLYMIGGLCYVELMQFITARGSMDIDDVILNFLGAVAVFALLWNKKAKLLMVKTGIIEE